MIAPKKHIERKLSYQGASPILNRQLESKPVLEEKMNKPTATDALRLSIPERIQLVEDIWDSIASQAEAIELTEDEKTLLDERLGAYHQNPAAGSPWGLVYQRITSQNGL